MKGILAGLQPTLFNAVAGSLAFALFYIFAPDFATSSYVTDGMLGIIILVGGTMIRKINAIHDVVMLIRMEHEQLMQWWQTAHPGEVRASVTYGKAMSMGKGAGR